jgi:hypothetical protein
VSDLLIQHKSELASYHLLDQAVANLLELEHFVSHDRVFLSTYPDGSEHPTIGKPFTPSTHLGDAAECLHELLRDGYQVILSKDGDERIKCTALRENSFDQTRGQTPAHAVSQMYVAKFLPAVRPKGVTS